MYPNLPTESNSFTQLPAVLIWVGTVEVSSAHSFIRSLCCQFLLCAFSFIINKSPVWSRLLQHVDYVHYTPPYTGTFTDASNTRTVSYVLLFSFKFTPMVCCQWRNTSIIPLANKVTVHHPNPRWIFAAQQFLIQHWRLHVSPVWRVRANMIQFVMINTDSSACNGRTTRNLKLIRCNNVLNAWLF